MKRAEEKSTDDASMAPHIDWKRRLATDHPFWTLSVGLLMLFILTFRWLTTSFFSQTHANPAIIEPAGVCSPCGRFPEPNDSFRFIPCTNATIPPPIEDPDSEQSWAALFDPDPDRWSWGNATADVKANSGVHKHDGRGIYLCGFLDLPLDYANESDDRIVRIAVTKFQVSGLARLPSLGHTSQQAKAGYKSERTIVLEPGGPGGSGTSEVWVRGEIITQRMSGGRFDVLGWDPRGVNISLPTASCFPHDEYRQRWSLHTNQYREASPSSLAQLKIADAMNNATFHACWERLGDFGRFLSTTHAARDLEKIREALDEEELTGYLMSYGTGVAQLYANLFPERVGRLVLDGSVYMRDYMKLGAMGWAAIKDTLDIWRNGFLSECIRAGPEHCALSRPRQNEDSVTNADLEARMTRLIQTLNLEPIPAYLESVGPMLITYSKFVGALYPALYMPSTWPATASMLWDLESGNSTAAAIRLDSFTWNSQGLQHRPFSSELIFLTMCADAHEDLDTAGDLLWWDSLWSNFTARSWLNGNFWFSTALPCRHFNTYWNDLDTYQGSFNQSLKNPVLLLSSTYDPATPLYNSRRLLEDMGPNARLVVHHGYGHTTFFDKSNCTDTIGKEFILNGVLPDARITECFANERPYSRTQHQWW